MKKAILMMFVLGFVSMNGYAQKVYKREGKVYLECTVASGMPAGSVTTTPKCKGGTASNTTFRNEATDKNIYASENDQVFETLEIDASDMEKSEASAIFTMDWVTAYNGCKLKKGEGWRLPTQRELMLMYIFRAKLDEMTGNNFDSSSSSGVYWASSENSSNSSCSAIFMDGEMRQYPKTYDFRVRCVREVAR